MLWLGECFLYLQKLVYDLVQSLGEQRPFDRTVFDLMMINNCLRNAVNATLASLKE